MTDTAGLVAEAEAFAGELRSTYDNLVYDEHGQDVAHIAADHITRLAAALAGGGGGNGSDPVAESAASGPSGPSKELPDYTAFDLLPDHVKAVLEVKGRVEWNGCIYYRSYSDYCDD